jgi:hypothetical protein
MPPKLTSLLSSLVAAGWTASSPDKISDEGERMAALERADYEGA